MKSFIIKFILFVFFGLLINKGLGQSNGAREKIEETDRLRKILQTDVSDSLRANILLKLSRMYFNTNLDSSIYYGKKGIDVSRNLNSAKMLLHTRSQVGLVHHNRSEYNKAREYFEKNLKLAESVGDSVSIAKALKNIGATYANENSMNEAVEHYLAALDIFESLHAKDGMAVLYGVLGNLYLTNNNYDQALNHYQKAGDLFRELGSDRYLATVIMNTGIVYKNLEKYEEAKSSYSKAAELYKRLGNKTGEAHCSGNLAILCLETEDYKESVKYNQIAYEYYKSNNMRKNEIITLLDIGTAYDSLYIKQKALDYYKQAYSMSDTGELISLRVELNMILYNYFKHAGDYSKALDYHEKYLNTSFSLLEKENTQKLDELLTKYETEQKEKRIALLEKQRKLDKIMNWSGFGLFISFFLISGNLFYSYRRKKKDNKLLADQNQKITQQKEEIFTQNEILLQQKEEITTQRDELDSSRNILSQQKQKLENVHYELTTSIHYAKSIQNATLPSNSSLKKILPEYFIFFKPQSIVGGDFYWSFHAHGKTYVAAADCTGHGVPGGFMSMLGMSFLNEIVNRESISEVDLILNRLRELVIESLHQKQTLGSLKDGMSVGICAIDTLKGTLEFAGANTPVYFLRKKEGDKPIPENSIENHSYILEEIKPDFMPISIHPKIRSFSKRVFALESIEALFMSSDGYTDQFGGENYKKYGKRAFKELLLKNADKPMEDQYSIVSETFETWKGENSQIDDVMVVGVKIA